MARSCSVPGWAASAVAMACCCAAVSARPTTTSWLVPLEPAPPPGPFRAPGATEPGGTAVTETGRAACRELSVIARSSEAPSPTTERHRHHAEQHREHGHQRPAGTGGRCREPERDRPRQHDQPGQRPLREVPVRWSRGTAGRDRRDRGQPSRAQRRGHRAGDGQQQDRQRHRGIDPERDAEHADLVHLRVLAEQRDCQQVPADHPGHAPDSAGTATSST